MKIEKRAGEGGGREGEGGGSEFQHLDNSSLAENAEKIDNVICFILLLLYKCCK